MFICTCNNFLTYITSSRCRGPICWPFFSCTFGEWLGLVGWWGWFHIPYHSFSKNPSSNRVQVGERLALGDPLQLKSHVTVTYPRVPNITGIFWGEKNSERSNSQRHFDEVHFWRISGSSFGFLGRWKLVSPRLGPTPVPLVVEVYGQGDDILFFFKPQFCWAYFKKPMEVTPEA